MEELNLVQRIAIWALPLIFAVTVHEAAHGWVADRLGDPIALQLGRISMNPLRHVDPMGTVVIPLLLETGHDRLVDRVLVVDLPDDPAPRVGDTGPFPATFSYTRGATSWAGHGADPESNITLWIDELTETSLSGRVTGNAVRRDENDNIISSIVVDMVIRAGRWIDGWPCE